MESAWYSDLGIFGFSRHSKEVLLQRVPGGQAKANVMLVEFILTSIGLVLIGVPVGLAPDLMEGTLNFNQLPAMITAVIDRFYARAIHCCLHSRFVFLVQLFIGMGLVQASYVQGYGSTGN